MYPYFTDKETDEEELSKVTQQVRMKLGFGPRQLDSRCCAIIRHAVGVEGNTYIYKYPNNVTDTYKICVFKSSTNDGFYYNLSQIYLDKRRRMPILGGLLNFCD